MSSKSARRSERRDTSGRSVLPEIAIILCVMFGWWLVTAGTLHPFKPYDLVLADYYDAQGEALLNGRLDVPCSTIKNEAFVVDGRCYGYFGIVPALLRIPLNFVLPQYRGHWAGLSMIVAYAVFLVVAHGFVRNITAIDDSKVQSGRELRFATLMYIFALGLGSTCIFLLSRPVIFHEAIAWASALALCSLYFSLRYMVAGAPRFIVWAGCFALLAIHSRPPAGTAAAAACALAPVVRALFIVRPDGNEGLFRMMLRLPSRGPVVFGAIAAALVVASYAAMNYAKFGTTQGLPIAYYKGMSPQKLEYLGGTWFHPENMRFQLANYYGLDDVRLMGVFPYFNIQMPMQDELRWQDIWAQYPEARINTIEPSLSLSVAMSGLLLLGVIGIFTALRYSEIRGTVATVLAPTLLGPMLLLMGASISYRYFHEYALFFAVAGAVAIYGLGRCRRTMRRFLIGVASLLILTNIAINIVFSIKYQVSGTHVGGPILEMKNRIEWAERMWSRS